MSAENKGQANGNPELNGAMGNPTARKVRQTIRWAIATLQHMLDAVPDNAGQIKGSPVVRLPADQEVVDRVITIMRPAVLPLKLRAEQDPQDKTKVLLRCDWPESAAITDAKIDEGD